MAKIPMGEIPSTYVRDKGADIVAVHVGEKQLTWRQLDEYSNRRACALSGKGVGRDDLVTLALGNSCEFFEWTFAIWKLGATPHLVSSRIAPAELEAMLGLVNPKVVIASDGRQFPLIDTLPAEWGTETDQSCELPTAIATYWKAMSSGGSTGRPKVIIDHRPGAFDTESTYLKIGEGEVVLNPGPLYHNAPFSVSHNALFKGNTLIAMPKFDAEEALRLIDQWKVSTVNFVPTMMLRIWRLPDEVKSKYDISSLRNVWHMAAPMPIWLKEAWIGWIGAEKIYEAYAGTEVLGGTLISGVDWLEHKGSVGQAKNCAITIRDEEGKDVGPGVVGEIFLRPNFTERMFHYLGVDMPKGSGDFESLGDCGWLDEDGFLYLADRRTDLVISGGANIYPAEIENAMMKHPGVRTAVVIGLPHEDLGASAHAIIQPDPAWEGAMTGDTMRDFLADKLVRYKIPRSFEIVTDDLRDEAGKVRRSKLREERLVSQ